MGSNSRLAAWWLLLSVICSSITSASTEFVFISPYSEVVPALRENVSACAEVSLFEFNSNYDMTADQVYHMCDEPNCVAVANALLNLTATNNSKHATEAFRLFAGPMLNFCWYHRYPLLACPPNPLVDFVTHFKAKNDACVQAANVSYLEPNGTKFQEATSEFLQTVSTTNPCPDECTELSRRTHYLYERMLCPFPEGQEVFRAANEAMFNSCVVAQQGLDADFGYRFRSDWGFADFTPKPVRTHHMTVIVYDDEPSPVPSRSPYRTLTPLTQSSGEAATIETGGRQGKQEVATSAPETTSPVQTTQPARPKSPAPTPDVGEASPAPLSNAIAPVATSDAGSSGAKHLVAVLSSTAAAVVLVVLIVLIARRRGTGAIKQNVSFHTVNGDDGTYQILSETPIDATSDQAIALQTAIPIERIRDIRLIGSGGFGVVYLVKDTQTNQLLASKRLVKNQLTTHKVNAFYEETQLVAKLHHPCIVSYVGATWTNRSDLQALFEYMDGGDLRTHLDITPVAPWTIEKLEIAINVADALAYVHTMLPTPIVHRDLKSRNILLHQNPRKAKLSDFGVARCLSLNQSMTTGIGTSRWLAPEVIVGGGEYDAACDIYSFGVVLSELDTHRVPFWDCRADESDSVLPEITILSMVGLDGLKPSFTASCPAAVLELAQACLSYDPRTRPSADAVATALQGIRAGLVSATSAIAKPE